MVQNNDTTVEHEQPPVQDEKARAEEMPAVPDDVLIILPVRNTVLFPGMVLPLSVGRKPSVAAAQTAARQNRLLGVLMQRDPEVQAPGPDDLHRVGAAASILRYVTTQDGSHHIICQGQQRIRVEEFVAGYPFLAARVVFLEEPETESAAVEARLIELRQRARSALELLPQAPSELAEAIDQIGSAASLADLVAGFLDIKPSEKQDVLETYDLESRMDRVLALLAERIQVLRLSQEISRQTKESMDERQREFLLREQLKTIRRELGEEDTQGAELEELRKAISEAGMPEEAEKEALKELKRLERMSEAATEYSMVRTYLDWLIELPWRRTTEDVIDIPTARRILDEDHYGLEKIKKRILEFLAVHKLNPEGKSPILCFVGPPGVGKTSLGQSIARAMGRKFVRASLGGVHDEAEIRGHRRTYVGAMPGNIIQSLRKAGSRNPVFMLDEMDKLGAGFHGDPASALLEVLDPEQNSTFRDNYLGVAFDLSKVMFIGTANVLDTIPGPLRDRMEVIDLAGYTEDEKVQIARRYLVRRQREGSGLREDQVDVSDEALHAIVRDYTREAGCRNLERQIGSVMRHVAMRIAEGSADRVEVGAGELREILGPRRYESELAMRTSVPGVATGLAWTPTGGDILFVEATRIPGSGRLILTGQLGDVMKESAQAALSLIKSRCEELGIEPERFEKSDIHIHVPAGAIPKDGPSAGVAIYTALLSLLIGRKVRNDTAMTGEITLRGLVLPVGGIKEKAVAAVQAGISTMVLPRRNEKDLEDIPPSAREKLKFVWVEHLDEVPRVVLADGEERSRG
jgi:ATP-dependent Lon protease